MIGACCLDPGTATAAAHYSVLSIVVALLCAAEDGDGSYLLSKPFALRHGCLCCLLPEGLV